MKPLSETLTPEKGLIFRITHRSNLPWILRNGLHCRRSNVNDPNFVSIGNPELIERRRAREVPVPPGGMLDEYVPFYFTPLSPMLLNITTGHGGIQRREREEIAVLVSSLDALESNGVAFVFTDQHAYLQTALFFSGRSDLEAAVDFKQLQLRNFKRDPEHPERFERYQAEALAYRFVPVAAILGVCCYTHDIRDEIKNTWSELGSNVSVHVRPDWYFS